MSDGTTGIQVAPIPTESEMASIRQIFTNVANALVRASELATQVSDLEGRFKTLSEDHTRVIARSDQLEQSLNEKREQLNTAHTELAQVKSSLSNMNAEFDKVVADAKAKSERIEQLIEANNRVNTEAAHYAEEADREERRANALEAQLASIKKALGIVDPPKPEPTPQPEPLPQPEQSYADAMPKPFEPVSNPEPRSLSHDEVAAKPEPQPTAEPYTWDPNKF